jgi:hypothetical protein
MAIAALKTSRSSLRVAYLCIADCRVPQALAGTIMAKGISQRLIPRLTKKIARDLLLRALLVSLLDPLNLPMQHNWAAVHAERFAPNAGGQIDSAVSQGHVN